ncbi:hypothetical protein EYZ11_010824 [Aspergillus tanneri]|uniref:Uncharacterized protein n=1 Tax=Aspergillus tanneri TaxID=1220188 RepID=A0A4V3UN43_9EURO|nr:hypothetical protein EYZ11_010824 [Aspergillus tanneri]
MSASRLSREGPLLPTHRPSSSHSEATVVHNTKDNERQVMPSGPSSNFNTLSDESPTTPPLSGGSNTTRPIESPGRPPLSVHARSTISVGNDVGSETGSQLPTSPAVSRTIDPKRWSPTKSTWLESALNRPESPRHKKQPSQQLSWTRDRQSKGSVDLGRKNSFKEVTPVGLMRTTAPGGHSKSSSVSGIPDIFTSQDSNESKDEPENNKASETQDSNASAGDKTSSTSTDVGVELQSTEDDSTKRSQAPPSLLLTQKRVDSPLSSPHVPLLNRPKPKSPVIDFRANLRRREVVKDESRKEEPEFKNIFGKLKKTETSNYVAPDKLKENILRGKASLSTTGGPKKSQRVDELKESILKQKEAMKAGGGSLRRNTAGELDAPPTAVPEAIAKRKNLTKSSSVNNDLSLDTPTSPSPEESETPQISQDTQPSPLPFQEQMDWDRYPVTQVATAEEPKPDTNYTQTETAEPGPFNSEKNDQSAGDRVENKIDKSILDKNQEISGEKAIKPVRALPSDTVAEAINTPAANEDPSAKGKLAGRINPALAGLLSRGPPVAVNGSGKTLPTNASKENGTDLSKHTAPLTHATKNRARGPKRRLPKATTTKAPESNPEDNIKPQEESPQPSISSKGPEASSSSYSSGWPLPDGDIATPISSEKGLTQLSPSTMNKPTEFKRTIPSTCERDIKTKSEGHDSDTSPRLNKCIPYLQKTPVENLDSLEGSPSSRPTPPSKSTAPSTPIVGQARGSQIQYSSPSPSPLRTSFKENQIYPPPSPYRKTTSGIGFPWSKDSSPRDKALPSPPVPPKNNQPADQLSSPRSSASLVPQAGESLEAISAFFKTFPSSSNRVDIDPQLMLESKPDNQKIRTLKKQMWEITGDGKRQDLPVHQEYILYEGSMYLCVHLFEADGSIRSETYLWCGDDVSDSAIDDAQAFSRKVARENGCKLEIIKQGKETSRFIQALGGILITRRGSSSRSSSSAIFMLCGRKHLGQMVFDEVDFSRRNLCTGYPFVISAMFGKLYLWKGKGSTAEEIGAARLIGMDLGLTGEFEEVGEGEEPESFFEVFPPYAETGDYMDAHYWRLKPNHDHFRLRLLRVDHELGQRSGFWLRRSGSSSPVIRPNDTVQEVEPFRQKDITGKGIFVLDVFFEIYVIVGEQASNRPAEFASAVVFAHEYGILAASLQDRPFIPKSYVSVGGLPDSCRSAFRKWEPRLPSTPPPRVFPLNAAIEAIRT